MTEQDRSDRAGVPLHGELVRAAPESMREWAEQLVAQARAEGVALTGEGGLLTDLMRHVLQTGLEVEMADHLGYERTSGGPVAIKGAKTSLLGSIRRADGSRQVSYAGHPLYLFSGDTARGQTNGEGLKDFGASWYVLTPAGQKIDRD